MRIQIHTERVREVGQQLLAEAQRIQETGAGLDSAIYGLDVEAWDGVNRARAEPLLEQIEPNANGVVQELSRLGKMLIHVADTFEQEDNTAAGNLAGMSWVDFMMKKVRGVVMDGIASVLPGLDNLPATGDGRVSQAEYDQMSWEERRKKWEQLQEEERRAQEELAAHQQRMRDQGVPEDLTIDQVDRRVETIDGNLEGLYNALQSARDSRDSFGSFLAKPRSEWNQEITALENQIAALESERGQLMGWRELLVQDQTLETNLNVAKENRQGFIGMVEADSTPDTEFMYTPGSSPPSNAANDCVNHATRRTDELIRRANAEDIPSLYEENKTFTLSESDTEIDLRLSGVKPGMAIVWQEGDGKPGSYMYGVSGPDGSDFTPPGPGEYYQDVRWAPDLGHVAIVEEVGPDYIVVSDQYGRHQIDTAARYTRWKDNPQDGKCEGNFLVGPTFIDVT